MPKQLSVLFVLSKEADSSNICTKCLKSLLFILDSPIKKFGVKTRHQDCKMNEKKHPVRSSVPETIWIKTQHEAVINHTVSLSFFVHSARVLCEKICLIGEMN